MARPSDSPTRCGRRRRPSPQRSTSCATGASPTKKSGGWSRRTSPAYRRVEAIVAGAVIETRDLRKSFGDVAAVRGLDLRVEPGSICGFLGRNGAGKTTTMKMLLGMTRPDDGHARVFGLDAADPVASVAIRGRTAFVDDDKDLFNDFSVARMIHFTSRCFPGWRRDLEQ